MAPHKQRPRIIDLLGSISSFKAPVVRVAAKYVAKVNTSDNFGPQFSFCARSCVNNHDCALEEITLRRMAAKYCLAEISEAGRRRHSACIMIASGLKTEEVQE